MLIHFIRYPVTTLGPGKRIGIWTQGCKRNCPKCMAGAFQDFDESKNIPLESIEKTILDILNDNKVDGVTISGGEPFEQEELPLLVKFLVENSLEDIILYTGNRYEDIKDRKDVLDNISLLIDGEYRDELNDNKPMRGSSNQRIIVLKKQFKERYLEYMKEPRRVEITTEGQYRIYVGMLPKGVELKK